ncbi:FMN-dependent NADH-azoreductase [Chelativorans sp. YIM 93263]|uniref:FMN-dependent NADH-azoreductase n=1 Tax=Chelativorans sp. YIM 93263 TaxID=2906648 RepID=UPI00237877FC|nr:FMN-dependent NADH-azoreductase [Chelativorans sp. YIM 93263]
MESILLVTSSPRGEASHSTRVAAQLARNLAAADPSAQIVHRDLVRDPLEHIGPDFVGGIHLPEEHRTEEQARAVAPSDAVVEEVFAADAIVIATGFINFSISSTLKAWLDHLLRAGITFRYTEDGPEGLIRGKKVYIVLASGGVYSRGSAAQFDHAIPYLKTALSFVGLTDVEIVRVEGVGMGAEAEQFALAQAENRIVALSA